MAPRANTTLETKAAPSAQVMLQRTGDESVLLDAASERYFGLNEVGTRTWELLAVEPTLRHVLAALLADYDVSAEQLERDLLKLLDDLADAGLVTLE